MIALKNVTKSYGTLKVLSGATLQIHPKDSICIVGDGGSGKSTLLKLLLRMEDPTSGSVTMDGVNLKQVPPAVLQLYRHRIGVAFQEPMLLEHATLAENIALPLSLFGSPAAVTDRMVSDVVQRLNLTSRADVLASDLSASERALCGIARALIANPMIIMADEPLLHLDALQAKAITEMLTNMQKHGATLIVFSRFAETAGMLGTRSITLAGGALTENMGVKKAAAKTADTHRILEDTGHPAEEPAEKEAEKPAKGDDTGGRKIRITSIGSGL